MKNISAPLSAHLAQDHTTLADLVKITRKDGQVFGFTTHDQNISFEGVDYKANGFSSTDTLRADSRLNATDYDLNGILSDDSLSEPDLKNGLFDHARIDTGWINWQSPEHGVLWLRRSWFGTVVFEGNAYSVRTLSFQDLLQRPVGEIYSPDCRFNLGDANCGVNLASQIFNGSVTALGAADTFEDYTLFAPENFYTGGQIQWQSGANAGLSMEIAAYNAATPSLTLWLPMPQPINIGDAYTLTPGCDKRLTTCKQKFSNQQNFGGFPHLPGLDKILQYPDTH